MNLLVDSHVFIWSYDELDKISRRALAEMSNPANNLFLSIASIWEIQIKLMLGKVRLKSSLAEVINEQQRINGFRLLPVNLSHVWELANHRTTTETRSTAY